MKSKLLLVFISGMLFHALSPAFAQTCASPNNNQTQSGTNDRWYAYFYRETNFTNYHGRVRYGTSGNPNFDVDFGASYDPSSNGSTTASTFNCALTTETFSVRAKLTKSFTAGTYNFKVGADDGVRLYIDGELIIDEWQEQNYAEFSMPIYFPTNGSHEIMIEYYENTGANRLSFSVGVSTCASSIPTETYGTGTWWNAYYYDGKNFKTYMGSTFAGSAATPKFDTNFGGDYATITTSGCPLYAETFSVRYRLRRTFTAGKYNFVVGGDDGYRFSIDGGATWLINEWNDHGYMTSSVTVTIPAGPVNMVLEYYENRQGNRVSFDMLTVLPVSLMRFDCIKSATGSTLNWITAKESTEDRFVIERSTDGKQYNAIGEVKREAATEALNGNRQYKFTDEQTPAGQSFYRLKIIDRNGPEKYSYIVSINSKVSVSAKIYPTLLDQHKQLFIQSEKNQQQVQVVIRNTAGQLLLKKDMGSMARGQIATLPLQQTPLSRGTYVVHVFAGNELVLRQAIVMP